MYILYKEAGYFTGLPLDVLCTVHGRAIAKVEAETSNFLKGNIRILDEDKVTLGHPHIGRFEKKIFLDTTTGEEVYKNQQATLDQHESGVRRNPESAKDTSGDGEFHEIVIKKVPLTNEEREAARPLRQAPCYDRLKNLGAVFGQKFGWERANFFATDGMEQKDDWSFRRSKWFKAVEKECKNVRENVGLLDMSAFAKCRVKGPKAEEFLDNLVANKLPKKVGRIKKSNKNGAF